MPKCNSTFAAGVTLGCVGDNVVIINSTRKAIHSHVWTVKLYLTTLEAAWCIILVDSVCLSFCQTITFKSLCTKLIFAHPVQLLVIWVKFIY